MAIEINTCRACPIKGHDIHTHTTHTRRLIHRTGLIPDTACVSQASSHTPRGNPHTRPCPPPPPHSLFTSPPREGLPNAVDPLFAIDQAMAKPFLLKPKKKNQGNQCQANPPPSPTSRPSLRVALSAYCPFPPPLPPPRRHAATIHRLSVGVHCHPPHPTPTFTVPAVTENIGK